MVTAQTLDLDSEVHSSDSQGVINRRGFNLENNYQIFVHQQNQH